jgi:hypothetical protein
VDVVAVVEPLADPQGRVLERALAEEAAGLEVVLAVQEVELGGAVRIRRGGLRILRAAALQRERQLVLAPHAVGVAEGQADRRLGVGVALVAEAVLGADRERALEALQVAALRRAAGLNAEVAVELDALRERAGRHQTRPDGHHEGQQTRFLAHPKSPEKLL